MFTGETIVGILFVPKAPDELPLSASVVLNVPVIVFTNLILVDVILSFTIPVAPDVACVIVSPSTTLTEPVKFKTTSG